MPANSLRAAPEARGARPAAVEAAMVQGTRDERLSRPEAVLAP